MSRRTARVVVVVVSVLALSGCSQAAALAPVGGDRLAEVRFGTLDALVEADIDLLTAPVCTTDAAATVTCVGTALDGREIASVSEGTAPEQLDVTAGGDAVYSGSLTDLLDRAAGDAG